MAALPLRLALRVHGGPTIVVDVDVPEGAILAGYELRIGAAPIVAMPFSLHDDSHPRYHTICRRLTPDIDQVDV